MNLFFWRRVAQLNDDRLAKTRRGLSLSRSKALLDSMTEDELRFSYGVVLQIEAHRQLGRQLDGNLKTCRIAIQEDVEAVKNDLVESNH